MTPQAIKLIDKVRAMEVEEFARLRKKAQSKLLDDMWSVLIRAQGGWKCALDGKDGVGCSTVLQGAHLITRGAWTIRYNLANGKCLCKAHHTYYTFRNDEWNGICKTLWGRQFKDVEEGKWHGGKNDYPTIYADFRARLLGVN